MRKHHYNVITPLNRFENMKSLSAMLFMENVTWHVITDDCLPFQVFWKSPWIKSYVCPNRETTFFTRCNFAINWFLDSYPPEPEQKYCILNDDDAYEPGFFDKIDQHEGEVIIPSMERGDQTPPGVQAERAHGATKLVAAPENMHIGGVGVEQIIISGRLLEGPPKVRIPLHICGDGMMVEWVFKTYGAEFAPEANVLFNRFEPGRWIK